MTPNAAPARLSVRIGAGTSVHSLFYIDGTPYSCGAEGSSGARRPTITEVDAPVTCARCLKRLARTTS